MALVAFYRLLEFIECDHPKNEPEKINNSGSFLG
jgi:hypothetical protein